MLHNIKKGENPPKSMSEMAIFRQVSGGREML
jgi:hypothetical protein